MIKVNKDYNDIPRILLSKEIEKAILEIKNKNSQSTYFRKFFLHKDVVEKLSILYHKKCAYCESILDTFEIDQYRPKSKYYWITFEWSNLLPVCHKCNISKSDKFPLKNETKRIITPQILKTEWLANSKSFIEEDALILNPEIDNPEEHFSFFTDGRIEGLTEKGITTIYILNLNRDALIQKRSSLISMFQGYFEQKIQYANELLSEEKSLNTKKATTILKLAFEHAFYELALRTNSDKEFALLSRTMFQNFQKYFVGNLKNKKDAEILLKSLTIFKSELFKKQNITDFNLFSKKTNIQQTEPKSISLKYLKITNIKCFNDIIIDFENKNSVLLGVNGRGKTTVLQLIALGLTQTNKPLFESEWKNVIRDNNKPSNFEIALTYDKVEYLLYFTIDKEDRAIYYNPLKEKKSRWTDLGLFLENDPFHSDALIWQLEFKRLENEIKELEKTYRDIDFNNFFLLAYGTGRNAEQHNYPLNENFKSIATLFGINNLSFKNGEISDFLNQKNAFNQIKKIITQIFNQADDIQNRVELKNFDKSTNTFYFTTPTNTDNEIPLNSMSSGFRTSFQWILDLVIQVWKKGYDLEQPELISGIVLIDEIDTHLHIKWQRTILHALHEVFKKIQFIVTTHSPFVVQSLEDDKIIGLQLNEKTNDVSLIKIENITGNSYESIINELFDEKSIFSVNIERLFNAFYKKREQILKKEIDINDAEFKTITKVLIDKGEEVANIVNRELRQLNFLTQTK